MPGRPHPRSRAPRRPADGEAGRPTEQKIAWIDGLLGSGVDILQIGSSCTRRRCPRWRTPTGCSPTSAPPAASRGRDALGPGAERERTGTRPGCGVEMFCMGVSASETHSRKNTAMAIAEANQRIIAIAKNALAAGKRVQVSVQSAFGCGYEGLGAPGTGGGHRPDLPGRGSAQPEPGRHTRATPRPTTWRGCTTRCAAWIRARVDLPLPQHLCLALANCYAALQAGCG